RDDGTGAHARPRGHRRGVEPAPARRAAPAAQHPARARASPAAGRMTVELAANPEAPPRRAVPVLELRDLRVEYATRTSITRAVDGVSLSIDRGEILGLAGESGCGKSTVANAVMQILRPPARVVSGEILFGGERIAGKSAEELRKFRWRNVSMVFQSAMNALNPVLRVGDQFVDMMRAHERLSKRDALVRAGELRELVGIDARRVRSYPHEL